MKATTTEIGTFLRDCRQKKEMNISQLAEESGISAAQISRIETGERMEPRPQTIKALSNALGVGYEQMMKLAGYLDA